MENTFHAFLTLKGKRLTGSFGSMHGLKIDKAVPDEISKDDLPYMEMIYRFVLVRKILLRLIFNKTRRATSYERGGVRRRKRPTDTTDRVTERLAIRQKVEVRTERNGTEQSASGCQRTVPHRPQRNFISKPIL